MSLSRCFTHNACSQPRGLKIIPKPSPADEGVTHDTAMSLTEGTDSRIGIDTFCLSEEHFPYERAALEANVEIFCNRGEKQ